MSRSDHGKPRIKTEKEPEYYEPGELGKFPFFLSGYAPSRNKKEWYTHEQYN